MRRWVVPITAVECGIYLPVDQGHRDIHLAGDRVTTGFFAGWLTPFALTCGLFALALFAFLVATYLTVDARSEPDLQDDFRLRGIWSQIVWILLSVIEVLTSKNGVTLTYPGLPIWWRLMRPEWTNL